MRPLGNVAISDPSDPYGKAINRQRRVMLSDRSAHAMCFMAGLLNYDGQRDAALAQLDRCLETHPLDAMAKYLKSLIVLADGDYKEGFRLYENRFVVYPATGQINKLCLPWRGEETERRVLVWHEGGVGDTMHFCRYFPEVLRRAPRAQFLVHPYLIDLLIASGIPAESLPRTRGDFDKNFSESLACSAMSLPHVLRIKLGDVAGGSYLRAPQTKIEEWRARLDGKPRIGFCWRGNKDHERDATRSMPLDMAMRLGESHDLFSLMQEHLKVKDWTDTAGIVANLDLIITVDTSIAHLAAAMGRPTWVLITVDHDWRWLRREDRLAVVRRRQALQDETPRRLGWFSF